MQSVQQARCGIVSRASGSTRSHYSRRTNIFPRDYCITSEGAPTVDESFSARLLSDVPRVRPPGSRSDWPFFADSPFFPERATIMPGGNDALRWILLEWLIIPAVC